MFYLIPVTTDGVQKQFFSLFGYQLEFTLRFNSVSGLWNFDLLNQKTNQYITQSAGLAVNSPTLIGNNLPFVVIMIDGSGWGINSTQQSELGSRLNIYFIDKEVFHEAIRASVSVTDRE